MFRLISNVTSKLRIINTLWIHRRLMVPVTQDRSWCGKYFHVMTSSRCDLATISMSGNKCVLYTGICMMVQISVTIPMLDTCKKIEIRRGLHAITKYHFLHDRQWISPWMKSISNELDITLCFLHNCLAIVTLSSMIVMSSTERKPRERDTGTMCEDRRINRHLWVHYIVQYYVTNCFCTHLSVILVFISLVAVQLSK